MQAQYPKYGEGGDPHLVWRWDPSGLGPRLVLCDQCDEMCEWRFVIYAAEAGGVIGTGTSRYWSQWYIGQEWFQGSLARAKAYVLARTSKARHTRERYHA